MHSFEIRNTLFVFVDTADKHNSMQELQTTWLKRVLSNTTCNNIVLFSHVPVEKLKTICVNYGVDLVIFGHLHRYSYEIIGGTEFITLNNLNRLFKPSGYDPDDDDDMTNTELTIVLTSGVLSYTLNN
jgi:UDP-2,3-diacylglucosamine pyrophosphatase LpxH